MNKPLFLLLAVLAAPFVAAQTAAPLSSSYQPADHAQTASHQPLQSERALISDSVIAAEGEMPLADVRLPEVHEEPLGDVAGGTVRCREMRRHRRPSPFSSAAPGLFLGGGWRTETSSAHAPRMIGSLGARAKSLRSSAPAQPFGQVMVARL